MKQLYLSKNKQTIVDDQYYHILNLYKWSYHNNGYASRTKKHLMLHRFLWELVNGLIPKGYYIDHINQDKLDNRFDNLRLVSASYNIQNSAKRSSTQSKYKGVTRAGLRWRARIMCQGIPIHLGYFKTECEAALAYNDAALQLYGKLAEVNSI